MQSPRRILTLCVSFVAGMVLAQAPAPTPPPVISPPLPAAEATKQTVRERERTIYVPYDQLEKVFQDGGKGVFLPYREFLDLWNELTLKRKDEEQKPPPADGVVSKAEYTGHVEGQTLVLDAKISVESFKKGWTTLVLSTNALTGIAEANTGKAVLRPNAGSCDVLLPDKGVYELALKLMLPVEQTAGKSRVALALPQAAVSRLVITVPGEGLEFEVKPSAAFTSRPVGGQTELSFFFGGSTTKTDVTWGAPQGVTQMTPLLLAETKLESKLGAGSIATTADLDFRILRAPMGEFKLSLPAGQEVLGVSGNNVKTWNVTAGANGRQQLVVSPDKPVKDSYAFKLQLEGPIAALPTEVSVPDLQVEGASYARGSAAIYTEPQFDVTPKLQEAVVRASTPTEARANLLAVGSFRVLKQPYKFTLNVEEAKPQVEVTSLTRLDIQRDAIRLQSQFSYNVRRVGIFETRIALPAGLSVSTVTGDQVGEWKVETTGGASTLLVKLPQQKTGDFVLKFGGRQLRARPSEDVAVPVFTIQGATRHEGKIGIGVHSSLEVNTSALGDLQQEDVNSLQTLNDARPAFTTEPSLAFRYRDAAKPATLAFKSRDAQVSVEVLTLVEAREQSTRHQWTLAFDVAYAAIDKVIIAVPKAVASEVRMVDPGVKETHKDYKPEGVQAKMPDAANYVLWEVVLRSEKLGPFQLVLSYEKQGGLEAGKNGRVELLQVHVPGAFQENGQVAVLKDNSLELRNATPEGLEEIDARELHGPLQKPGVFQAYKYRALPIKLAVETAKNAYHTVPQAIITHADLTTAVATDQAQSTEAIYWVKNIDLQFLVVKLPKDARLLSDIFVGREAQQPMKREGSDDVMVRLPSGATAAQSAFPVRFVYATAGNASGERLGAMGSILVQPPVLAAVNVLETRHRLFLPEAYHYLAFDGPLTQAVRERGWGRVQRTLRYVLPVFGASLSDRVIASLAAAQSGASGDSSWSNPPQVPSDFRSLYDFQVPQQGHAEILRRLGAPAPVTVHFRSKGVTFAFEAFAFLLIVALGIFGMRWPVRHKLGFLVLGGVLGMIAIGMFSPANCLVAIAWMRALFCVALLWFVCGFITLVKTFLRRPKHDPKPRPPAPPPRMPVTAPPSFRPAPASAPTPPPVQCPPPGPSPSPDDSIVLPELKDDEEPNK
ncbi:MAG: hypothetical protein JWO89_3113 [Verrucomicrobiaceae bacterium]|nr:hypothetical protein [Verrucomicrobiaceae bacterium]